MPESTGTVTSVKPPSSTIAFTGFAVGGGPSVPTIAWSTYVPGARAISNRPTASVRSLPATEPSRRARTSTPGIGSSGQGDASCTTGHCGPSRTTPRTPAAAAAPPGPRRPVARALPFLPAEPHPVPDDEARRDLEAAVAHFDLDPLD